ncbi:MAG: DUF6567 family protein [Flavobacteriales bacterium]
MMRRKVLLALLALPLFLSSCGYHTAEMLSTSRTQTEVKLSKANYEVKKRVTGQASTVYVLGIGGFDQKLISEARAQMFKNAKLTGGSKTIINVSIDKHRLQVYPFFWKTTYTASGYVIEFKE